jgi:hypothetical protein
MCKIHHGMYLREQQVQLSSAAAAAAEKTRMRNVSTNSMLADSSGPKNER